MGGVVTAALGDVGVVLVVFFLADFFAGATALAFFFAGAADLTFFFAGVAALTVVAGAVETAVTGAAGVTGTPASVGVPVAVTGTSGVIGIELAAKSAMCVFQAKLEITVRKAVDEIVAVAIRARRAGCGLRANILVIAVILAIVIAIILT